MSVRVLMMISAILGSTQLVACSGSDSKGDDDDDTVPVGDDDDVDDQHTGPVDPPEGLVVADLTQMIMYVQFTLVAGELVPAAIDGGDTFETQWVLFFGPDQWDPNDPMDTNFCTVSAALSLGTSGVLETAGVHLPYVEVAEGAATETNCAEFVTDAPSDEFFTQLFTLPGWSAGVPLTLSAEALAELDAQGLERGEYFGAVHNVPLLVEPLLNGFFGIGAVVDADAVLDRADLLEQADLTSTELVDGIYFLDPFIIFDTSTLFEE
jgi:hypothetical protein